MGHVNPNLGEVAEIATYHQPLGLFIPCFLQYLWVVRYGLLVVETWFASRLIRHACPNWHLLNSSATERGTQT
eukprot:1160304-Pelagomonas_calceolata.AAC.9